MFFTSPLFLFGFLPATLAAYYLAARARHGQLAQWFLILASMVFYGYWNTLYLGLLLCSLSINFVVGKRLSARPSRVLLSCGLVFNLSLLAYFKYTDFAIENLNAAFGQDLSLLHILLPLGISFFTFQKIGYLVDCYRGLVDEHDPRRFMLFVLFFPQLIAGPIVHHAEIIPQLKRHQDRPVPNPKLIAQGLFFIVIGLFKKVLIADSIGAYADLGFSRVADLTFVDSWTTALAYSLQLFFDFSAYSEIAVGLALLFGIRLPQNFNSPYKATSITDFWRRWHITLGAFMRSYLYIPLGGNKGGIGTQMLAVVATMVIGGIWHGAAWTFVAWGALHALLLAIHKLWIKTGLRITPSVAVAVTLMSVISAWVPFRATSIADSVRILRVMYGLDGIALPALYSLLSGGNWLPTAANTVFHGHEILWLILGVTWCLKMPNTYELWDKVTPSLRWAAGTGALGISVALSLGAPTSFMYWSF